MFWKVFKLAWVSMLMYPPLFLLAQVMTLVSYIVSPFLALYSVLAKTNTPGGLWPWFYTHDNTLDGGFDAGIHGYENPYEISKFKLWWQRTKWVCRNPAYGFQAKVLGFVHTDKVKIVLEEGVPYPEDSYWYVIRSDSGFPLFGFRGAKMWLGWNYMSYGGWHQLKARPWRFG